MSRRLFLSGAAVVFALASVVGCAPTETVKPLSDEVLKARRDTAQMNYSIAVTYYSQANYDAALQNAQRSLEFDSTYFDPYILIGNVWRKQRDAVQAEDYYRRAIAIDPGKAKGYEALGDLLLERGQFDNAVAVYQEGLSRDASLVDLYNGIVDIYMRQGKTAQADSVFKEAMARFPEDGNLQRMWAEFLQKQGRHGEAAAVLVVLTAKYPTLGLLRDKLATSYVELKEYNKALAQLDTLATLDPANERAVLLQGIILGRQGKASQALAKFDALIAKDTTKALPYLYKGEALLDQGNLGGAENYLRKALAKDNALLQAWLDIGDVRKKQAVTNMGKNLTATSTDKLKLAKSQFEEAKGYYNRASSDNALAAYARAQTDYCVKSIELIDRELFIR